MHSGFWVIGYGIDTCTIWLIVLVLKGLSSASLVSPYWLYMRQEWEIEKCFEKVWIFVDLRFSTVSGMCYGSLFCPDFHGIQVFQLDQLD